MPRILLRRRRRRRLDALARRARARRLALARQRRKGGLSVAEERQRADRDQLDGPVAHVHDAMPLVRIEVQRIAGAERVVLLADRVAHVPGQHEHEFVAGVRDPFGRIAFHHRYLDRVEQAAREGRRQTLVALLRRTDRVRFAAAFVRIRLILAGLVDERAERRAQRFGDVHERGNRNAGQVALDLRQESDRQVCLGGDFEQCLFQLSAQAADAPADMHDVRIHESPTRLRLPFDARRAAPAIASAAPIARARRGDDARALYSDAFGFLRARGRISRASRGLPVAARARVPARSPRRAALDSRQGRDRASGDHTERLDGKHERRSRVTTPARGPGIGGGRTQRARRSLWCANIGSCSRPSPCSFRSRE
ncbi:hypothetical protein DM75_3526 [Burkholderia mallei]|nr:hypothetical protein DM75_3526 [Burkholderia mallei]